MTTKKASKPASFAQSFAELEKITSLFERDDLDLDEAMKEYERGLVLAKQLKTRLKELENTVETLKKKFHEPE
jgi:exodeoxyribonuclease VII small subunit